jgi:hypothetical protein
VYFTESQFHTSLTFADMDRSIPCVWSLVRGCTHVGSMQILDQGERMKVANTPACYRVELFTVVNILYYRRATKVFTSFLQTPYNQYLYRSALSPD